jgi:hypothetical protein
MKRETAEELSVAMNNITTRANQKMVGCGFLPQEYTFTPVEVSPTLWGIKVAIGGTFDPPQISVEEFIMCLIYTL